MGDGAALGEIAVRIPKQEFLLKVLNLSGPLAMASASPAGFGAVLEIDYESEIVKSADLVIDLGALPAGALSSVVRNSIIGKVSPLEISRVGAITFEEIAALVPEITVATA